VRHGDLFHVLPKTDLRPQNLLHARIEINKCNKAWVLLAVAEVVSEVNLEAEDP